MDWACGAYRWGEGVYRVLVEKPGGRRPLGRPRHRWVDNIRMDLQEVGCGYMDWIGLSQDRDRWRTLVSAVMNLWVPWNAGNFLTSCKPVSCSRRTVHRGVSKFCLPCYIFIYIRHISIKPVLCSRMVSLFHHTSPWTHRCLQSSPSAHRNWSVFRRSVQTACCNWILNRGISSSNWNSYTNASRLWWSVCWCEYSKTLGKVKCVDVSTVRCWVRWSVLMWVQ